MPKIEKLYDMECRNELGDMMSKQGMEQNENKQYSKLLHGGISVRNFKEPQIKQQQHEYEVVQPGQFPQSHHYQSGKFQHNVPQHYIDQQAANHHQHIQKGMQDEGQYLIHGNSSSTQSPDPQVSQHQNHYLKIQQDFLIRSEHHKPLQLPAEQMQRQTVKLATSFHQVHFLSYSQIILYLIKYLKLLTEKEND